MLTEWAQEFDRQVQLPDSVGRRRAAAQLLAGIGHLPGSETLGFTLGTRIPVTALGEIGMGFRVAPTLRDGMQLVADFHYLSVPLIHYTFSETALGGAFDISFRQPIPHRSEAALMAMSIAMLCHELRLFGVRGPGIRKIDLTFSSSGMESHYRKFLGVTPATTSAARNVCYLDRSVLDSVNPTADLHTFNRINADASASAEQHNVVKTQSVHVQELVMASISKPPSMKELAQQLGLSPRQLRQALLKEKSSYQAIVRDCRIEYAGTLLNNSASSIIQVANRLGYSDPAVFSHAFKRWTGESPTSYRARRSQAASADLA